MEVWELSAEKKRKKAILTWKEGESAFFLLSSLHKNPVENIILNSLGLFYVSCLIQVLFSKCFFNLTLIGWFQASFKLKNIYICGVFFCENLVS